MYAEIVDEVIRIARAAGDAIMAVYNSDEFGAEAKADASPVTLADLAAHRIICPTLQALLPDTPVLSEEGNVPDYSVRRQWHRYWIVDPLDGTKEFINRNGEFTVNIALIEQQQPVLGVVHVPTSNVTYAGMAGSGAVRINGNGRQPIHVRTMAGRGGDTMPVTVVASRRHGSSEVAVLMERIGADLGAVETKSMGSSLKFCLVAEGAADIYPRLAPTCEWDTAAAQAIVEAAGGQVLDPELRPLRYNRKDQLLNPHFYVIGDPDYDWGRWLSG